MDLVHSRNEKRILMPERPLLVTSIAPHNVENQQRAIASWLPLGFAVASLNTPSEIDRLKPLFGGVEFVAVGRDARADCGKPLVYLDDVVAFLAARGSPVCGLINSDIHLRATPEIVRHLLKEAGNSMVLASRTDVNTLDDSAGEVYKFGFDVFLFDRAILGTLPSTEFCLGQPWWDLWLPSCLIRPPRRFALKFASSPFAYRVGPPEKTDADDGYEKCGMRFAAFVDPGTHDALRRQAPETRRNSLESLSVNVAMAILFECQWISCFPE
jgi:hypothetical protein